MKVVTSSALHTSFLYSQRNIPGTHEMKIKQWMEKAKDREQWGLVVEEAKAHPGL
jgi:hypothetical protein